MKAISWAVMVVPILAPRITPIAWARVMNPELTKPITITVVADELWMMAVTPAPTITADTGLEVMVSKNCLSRLPASFCNPLDMICIPNRKMPSPPTALKAMFLTMAPDMALHTSSTSSTTSPAHRKPVFIFLMRARLLRSSSVADWASSETVSLAASSMSSRATMVMFLDCQSAIHFFPLGWRIQPSF